MTNIEYEKKKLLTKGEYNEMLEKLGIRATTDHRIR